MTSGGALIIFPGAKPNSIPFDCNSEDWLKEIIKRICNSLKVYPTTIVYHIIKPLGEVACESI
jgi:hypothetical protein